MRETSSSSGSSSSSSSSSCSDTGSTTSDTESSSSPEERGEVHGKNVEKVSTRRKSSEFKAANRANELEKSMPSTQANCANKTGRSGNAGIQMRAPRLSNVSSEDDIAHAKKQTRPSGNAPSSMHKKKASAGSSVSQSSSKQPITTSTSGGGGKAPPSGVKNQQSESSTSKYANNKATSNKQQPTSNTNNGGVSNGKELSHSAFEMGKDQSKSTKNTRMPTTNTTTTTTSATNSTSNANRLKQVRGKVQAKRNVSTKSTTRRRSTDDESDTESLSESGDDTTTSSESEGTESTNSYASHPNKATKGKRGYTGPKMQPQSDSDDLNMRNQDVPPRKLTRSLSTRRTKQQLRQGVNNCAISESDSDALLDLDVEKRSLSKSPAKKPPISKCKTKKDMGGSCMLPQKPRSLSPPQQTEKKCPIEGCDSSGHLSGNLDKHFLPEACPIYHNMSASECKERANERKLRDEHRLNNSCLSISGNSVTGSNTNLAKTLTAEQKEFLAKIRESRSRFKPVAAAISSEKVKLEKDCSDEDREPCLTGLVPDYDLQLFREAQAIASEKVEDELKDLPVGKGIKYITMGKYKMKVWYQSPYPDDAARLPQMYICEFCLRYQKSETGIKRHALKCVWRHPPGDEIYRKGKLQVWQVDGKRHKQYCQHLCLLAKFFLDHKTLYYDVEPFLFYIMTLADVDGCHTVGYFSKEKNSFYNVSCILTLPPYQRKGYGRLLIDFSYLLTRVEQKIGSPEKPLSDLGLISYRSYWKDVLLDYLCNRSGNTLSIKDVSQEMAIYSYDIVSTLQALGMMKYWKGKHIVLKKQEVLEEYEKRVKHRGNFPKIDNSCLRWSPFVPPQNNNTA